MKPRVRFEGGTLVLYAVLWFVFFTAGAYFGGTALVVRRIIGLALLVDLAHVALVARGLYLRQEFSTHHPTRGDRLIFTLVFKSTAFLPPGRVILRFDRQRAPASGHAHRGPMRTPVPHSFAVVDSFPPARRFVRRRYVLRFPHRGAFRVGLALCELHDLFGLVRVEFPAWQETVLVLPRVVELASCRLPTGGTGVGSEQHGPEHDYTRFRTLEEYREGEDMRHIAWGHFARTGVPVLRRYESAATAGLTVYLDLRGNAVTEHAADCAIEIVAALARLLTTTGVPMWLRAGDATIELEPDERGFVRFLDALATLPFGPTAHFVPERALDSHHVYPDPIRQLEADIAASELRTRTVVGVWTAFDARVEIFLEDYRSRAIEPIAVVVGAALKTRHRARLYAAESLIIVRDASTILEDLS